MNFKDLLIEKKSAIVKKWFDLIIETYPSDPSNYFKKQTNPFLNPVGHTISEGIDGLFDELLNGVDSLRSFSLFSTIFCE